MRKLLIVMLSVLLSGCVQDFAIYMFDGHDHSLTVRRQQNYFWQDTVEVQLRATNLPQCQRLHTLSTAAPADIKVELFAAGDGVWNIRMGKQLWQAETNTCNQLTEMENDPKADLGQRVGQFVVVDEKLAFEPAQAPAPAQ
ncbi:hypothetical protein [Janthinobacterium sp. HLX7-2]|uniref:hypothetical protein n=1 Tax=Janthinobacterium sp. HLX7-2 TaxID=1259331 RepID=UPI003F25AFFE